MGIEPYIIASSVVAVAAQRLVRLLCPHCKKEYLPSQADIHFLQQMKAPPGYTLYGPGGCTVCDFTGNLGRTAVKEIIVTDSKVRDMVVEKSKASDIEEYLAKEKDQRFMVDDALSLILSGKVYIREILSLPQLFDD